MRGERILMRWLRDQRGATAVEYGLILSLIVIGLVGVLSGVAGETLKMWAFVQSESVKAHNGED
ncbi:Flp family type IVb pilin [Novosphingobium sp. RD2P27]|uniref:Flp family type IVb pilin n=1 Tax=Novosphingobium kalidii TaxID=3230299 RepID=A0ABV2D3G4_9SPHN